MWNSFPWQIHSLPLGGSCHKGLAAAQLTVQKQSQWLRWPSVPSEWPKKITHWKLYNYCTMQLLRRLASSVSWERRCLVFCEWYGGCVAIFSVWTAQTSSTCSTWSGRHSLQLQFPYLKGLWLPISPDLSCIYFVLWGHWKGQVHKMNPHTHLRNIRPTSDHRTAQIICSLLHEEVTLNTYYGH